ncbi:hypothetical protein Hypma_012749 [Hypsizygus marmoreus]|uniref:Uncharacterized protein n=1 Tax=Hypsizygus marmoreus TaxID=39966 RepID=A0A369JMV0_HYPMA|nr:hypothetical protein Hypma_012749 [Hypsizygus marmoreus]
MAVVLAANPSPSTTKAIHAFSTSVSSSIHSTAQLSVSTNTSTAPSSSVSHTQSLSKKRARHSLNVLGSIPKDISALIRSHSLSRRQQTEQHQDPHIDAGAADMVPDDDRPSRKPRKSENRVDAFPFYNFSCFDSDHLPSKLYNFIARSLTRSRSRSRSRSGREPDDEPVPDLPDSPSRLSNAGHSSSSKPVIRIQSRPLSSTTTATNTTITPGTPRAKKRPPSAIPIPDMSPKVADPFDSPSSRPPTPKASTTRKKLHNLFGIPLSSPRKSSFSSSRQSSRRPSLDVIPPLPGQEKNNDVQDTDPTPKALKSHPHLNSRPESPSPTPRTKMTHNPSNSSTATSSTSASSRLQKFFTSSKTPSAPSADAVSGPMRRPSASSHLRHNSNSTNASNSPTTEAAPVSRPKAATGLMGPPPVPPRIVHVPATPDRPGTAPQIAASSSVGHSSRKNSVDSGYRYPGGVTGAGNEKGKDKDVGITSVNGHARPKMNVPHRSTKHGSFDFERPGWSAAGAMQRTGSGGTMSSGTGTSGGWGRGQEGVLSGVRESAMGPGMAGVGTLQREVSMKRAKDREEMVVRAKEGERRRRRAEAHAAMGNVEEVSGEREKVQRHLQPSPRTTTPDGSGGAGTSTSASGKSSSWGRKRGGLFPGGSTGNKKLTSIGISHGPFAFEPPVPSPTRSTGSTGTTGGHDAPLSVSWAGEKGRGERDRERGRMNQELERERMKLREKEKRATSAHRGDRPPVPVPPASFGHRSGSKGRSLDLGLGLAWAPTTVREDALLPSSRFFERSVSGSSSVGGRSGGGRSASGSTNGGHETIEEEKQRSGIGREVAEVFKNALDDAGYATFKKYVHRFDAHDIPFDGPMGIVARVERLLTTAPDLSEEGKRRLLDSFVRVILQNL